MVRGRNTEGMVVLLFLAATPANAAPTIGEHNSDFIVCALSVSSDTYTHTKPEISQVTGPYNSCLATVAVKFHRPSVSFTGLPAPVISVRSLPPVPRAALMVLI